MYYPFLYPHIHRRDRQSLLTAVFNANWTVFPIPAKIAFKGDVRIGIQFHTSRFHRTGFDAFAAPVATPGIDVFDACRFIDAEIGDGHCRNTFIV
jgi:hypothetical protein